MIEDQRRRVAYVVSPDLVKISSLLPSNKGRSVLVHSLASALGFFHSTEQGGKGFPLLVIQPKQATARELTAYHSGDYIDFVLDPLPIKSDAITVSEDSAESFGLEDDCPRFLGLPAYVRLVAGASIAAASAVKDESADISICWDGGRHHAQKSQAAGFCYVADCVLSILHLKRMNPRARIMYLDLDLHFSDGVSQAFLQNNKVLTLSIHHAAPGFYPATPLSSLTSPDTTDPYTLSLPLEAGASCDTFYRIWQAAVSKVFESFDPEYVVVQCGTDGLAGDPYAIWNWGIDVNIPGSMGWCLQEIVNWHRKTVLLGGGGYNSPNVARAWAYLTSIACEAPLPVDTHIPDHKAYLQYAPSFLLDVPPGNMRDNNSPEYLDHIEATFTTIARRLNPEAHLDIAN